MNLGFIGLGSMGSPIASNLRRAGHELIVYNRTRSRAEELARAGARIAETPQEAATGVEVLITMLADDSALEAVMFGSGPPDHGALAGLDRGAIHLSMSTISLALAQRLTAEHESRGQVYLAAPVFGRPEAAQAGKLWIIAAGTAHAIERCRPIFDAVGQGVEVVGAEPLKANVIKIIGNFVLAAAIEALGEAFALVRKHGMEPTRLLEIVNGKLLRSPVYENYGGIIANQRFEPAGFKLRHGLKDIRLALAAGDQVNAPLPLASVMRDHYLAAMARGWGDIDWAGLARVSALDAGLDRSSAQSGATG